MSGVGARGEKAQDRGVGAVVRSQSGSSAADRLGCLAKVAVSIILNEGLVDVGPMPDRPTNCSRVIGTRRSGARAAQS